jgi:hypothetical protein
VSNKILLHCFALNHCHSRFTALTGATACDCVTPGENVGEELVDFFGAHMMDIKVLGAVAN